MVNSPFLLFQTSQTTSVRINTQWNSSTPPSHKNICQKRRDLECYLNWLAGRKRDLSTHTHIHTILLTICCFNLHTQKTLLESGSVDWTHLQRLEAVPGSGLLQQLYSNVACPPLYLCWLSPFSELCPTHTHTNWGWASLCQLERQRKRARESNRIKSHAATCVCMWDFFADCKQLWKMLHYKTLITLKCSDFRTEIYLIFLLNFLLSSHLLTSCSCLLLVLPLSVCPLPTILPSSFCQPKTQKHFTSPLHSSVLMCVVCSQLLVCRCPWTAWRRGSGPSLNRSPTLTCCNAIWIICEWQPRNNYRLNKHRISISFKAQTMSSGFTRNLITII